MVLNVAFNVLAPDDRVVVFFVEESVDVCGPRFNSLKLFLAVDGLQVFLDSPKSFRSNVVAEDTE